MVTGRSLNSLDGFCRFVKRNDAVTQRETPGLTADTEKREIIPGIGETLTKTG